MTLEEGARETVRTLQKAGHIAYFAGGSVRDQLMERESKDIDIATSARPEEVQSLFRQTTDLQGKIFGVVRVLQERTGL
jgi:tRNA nucleotidyltransferase/poly(A) polymerase